jgi:hypothetical protein
VDAIRINILNEKIKWMRVADIPNVAELKKKIDDFEESIIIVTFKGKLLKDTD